MSGLNLHEIASTLQQLRVIHVVWMGLGILSLWLLLMLVTRWGHSKPLAKCFTFSLLGHCVLALYSTTVLIAEQMPLEPDEPLFRIERVELPQEDLPLAQRTWDRPPVEIWETSLPPLELESPPLEPLRPPESEHEPPRRSDAELPSLRDKVPGVERPGEPPEQPQPQKLAATPAEARNLTSPPPAVPPDSVPERQQSAETPLPEPRENRLPLAELPSQPAPDRAVAAPTDPPFDSALPPAPRRQEEIVVRPNRPLVNSVDLPSRRREAAELLPPPELVLEGPEGGDPLAEVREPALPAAPSLRERPGVDTDTGIVRTPAEPGSLNEPPLPSAADEALPPSHNIPGSAEIQPYSANSSPDRLGFRRMDQLPLLYSLRRSPQREQILLQHGGTEQSEQAVQSALRWLADHQSPDGRWDADGFHRQCPDHSRCLGIAGRELQVNNQDRGGAGATADTGMTALALLAFLGAGHTHRDGPYADTVARGVRWLLEQQGDDGNLSARADSFAFMYCHAMATIAVGEAYGMTSDVELFPPLRRAVEFIIRAQDPNSGGWRYRPQVPGDTSVFGWQVMALKSAELAGVPIPSQTWEGCRRFLHSVSAGRDGALASYRPLERASPAMTAEALLCRQLLERNGASAAYQEAAQYLLENAPDPSRDYNLYYWYYGTLSLYHQGGEAWSQWNDALQRHLSRLQNQSGHPAGSWDPISRWAGYGGRIYSTAMATLCLEVYYRYLPLYSIGEPGHGVQTHQAARETARREQHR